MQKYLQISLVFLLTSMSISLHAQTINIPDANFKSALIALGVDTNNDGEIQRSEALTIKTIITEFSPIASLEGIEHFLNLENLNIRYGNISQIDVSDLKKLVNLELVSNQIINFDINDMPNLKKINFFDNQIVSFSIEKTPKLEKLDLTSNFLTNINLSNLVNLEHLDLTYNNITYLDLGNLTKIKFLGVEGNELEELNLIDQKELVELYCEYNQLRFLDLSNNSNIETMYYGHNPVEVVILKNNVHDIYYTDISDPRPSVIFNDVPKLKYLCVDEEEYGTAYTDARNRGYTHVIINSDCNTTSAGATNIINGNSFIDLNNEGCNEETPMARKKIKYTSEKESGYIISGEDGNFSIALNAYSYKFIPELENPEFYTVTPNQAIFAINEIESPTFCVEPIKQVNDLMVNIILMTRPRPGFSDGTYMLSYLNKGTTSQNTSIQFEYESNKMQILSSSSPYEEISSGVIKFNNIDLAPLKGGKIYIVTRTNSPQDIPAINVGDILELSAQISGLPDHNPEDNFSQANITVVGSFDPNDKTCLEGEIVSPELIGKNVHYLIRFENTGTAPAENVVITDYIDTTVLDISSLLVTDASHICHTQISKGNKVQFIFNDIQLPFTEPDKHGHVAFSIKLKDHLVIGDSIKNKADIFFDYNLPIETNIAAAEINYKTVTYIGRNQTLKGSLDVYPNPSNGQFALELKANIKAPAQISILNVEGKVVFAKSLNHQNQSNLSLDLKHLAKGVYLIKAQIENDVLSKKVVIQ